MRVWSTGRSRKGRVRPIGAVKRRNRAPSSLVLWGGRAAQATAVLAAIAGGAYGAVRAYRYVADSPVLVVEEVRVKGVRAMAGEEVAALAGVARGDAILDVDLAAVDARVEAHPRVASAVVKRLMPKTIEIEIVEREPKALVNRAGELVGLDAAGHIVPVYKDRERVRGPIVTGVRVEGFAAGERVRDAGLEEALRCVAALTPGLQARVSEVRVTADGEAAPGVALILSGSGTYVRMGRGAYEEKVRRLAAALDHFAARGERKEYVDVRFQDVVTRP